MSEWKKVKLGECCEITSSKRCHASERSKEGIPFYCSKEIIQLENGQYEPIPGVDELWITGYTKVENM